METNKIKKKGKKQEHLLFKRSSSSCLFFKMFSYLFERKKYILTWVAEDNKALVIMSLYNLKANWL